jgi:hypothetical protein
MTNKTVPTRSDYVHLAGTFKYVQYHTAGVWEPVSRNSDSDPALFPNPYQNPDNDFVTTMNSGAIFGMKKTLHFSS